MKPGRALSRRGFIRKTAAGVGASAYEYRLY
ncbi:MAG: twin-arginine translocation signal domain-containing protein [Deltaproteobacteria bacterium]|nr:twin-arginine translocation signal domain-containing protein [Deltaproteobacteria bacterium]